MNWWNCKKWTVLTCLLHFELHKGLQCSKRSVNKRIFAKKYLGITYIIIISWFLYA